jgi:hypothetical protein
MRFDCRQLLIHLLDYFLSLGVAAGRITNGRMLDLMSSIESKFAKRNTGALDSFNKLTICATEAGNEDQIGSELENLFSALCGSTRNLLC